MSDPLRPDLEAIRARMEAAPVGTIDDCKAFVDNALTDMVELFVEIEALTTERNKARTERDRLTLENAQLRDIIIAAGGKHVLRLIDGDTSRDPDENCPFCRKPLAGAVVCVRCGPGDDVVPAGGKS